jgi:hypothetical protein
VQRAQCHFVRKRERERFLPWERAHVAAHAPLFEARSEWSGGSHGSCSSAARRSRALAPSALHWDASGSCSTRPSRCDV